jgi:hypothetical protein
MNTRTLTLLCSLPLLLAIPFSPSRALAQAESQGGRDDSRIAGKWVLNEEQSDDPATAFQGRGQGGRGGMREGGDRPPGGRPSGSRPSGGRQPGGRGGTPGNGDRDQMRERMGKLMEASAALNIVQDDSTVTIVGIEGSRIVLYPDGRKVEYPVEGAGNVETRAPWVDGSLVVERTMEGGPRATQTYELASEGRQMHIRVRLEGGQLPAPLEFRRVYDLQDGGI